MSFGHDRTKSPGLNPAGSLSAGMVIEYSSMLA